MASGARWFRLYRSVTAPSNTAADRDRTAGAIRHLVDAVKLGRSTDTLLGELQAQEAALKALERGIAELGGGPEKNSLISCAPKSCALTVVSGIWSSQH
jgi:hypothetical protein